MPPSSSLSPPPPPPSDSSSSLATQSPLSSSQQHTQQHDHEAKNLSSVSISQLESLFHDKVALKRKHVRGARIWRRPPLDGSQNAKNVEGFSRRHEHETRSGSSSGESEDSDEKQQPRRIERSTLITRQAYQGAVSHSRNTTANPFQNNNNSLSTGNSFPLHSDLASESSELSEKPPPRAELRRNVINAALNRGGRGVPGGVSHSGSSTSLAQSIAPVSLSHQAHERRAPPRAERVVQDGRLVRKNPQFLIGKRSNQVFINRSDLHSDSFGQVSPRQYFGQVFVKDQAERNAFFLEHSEDGSSMVSGTTTSSVSDEYSEYSDTMSVDTPSSVTTGTGTTLTVDQYAPLIPVVKRRVHAVPREPIRSILQRPDTTTTDNGIFKQTRFADNISTTAPEEHSDHPAVPTHQDGASALTQSPVNLHGAALRTPDIRTPRQEIVGESVGDGDSEQKSYSSDQHLFTKPTNITRTPDMSSPPVPTVSFNMDDFASSPGDRSSSFHSIPAQIAYSPDLGALGESMTNKTGTTNAAATTTLPDTTNASFSETTGTSIQDSKNRSPRTASLLRTPSDDEDSLSTSSTSRKRKRELTPRPPATMEFGVPPPMPEEYSSVDSTSDRRNLLNESTFIDDPAKFLGGQIHELDETAQIDPRPARPQPLDESTMRDEDQDDDVVMSPTHVYKPIRYQPRYQELGRNDDDDLDAEYIERHNDDSDDETYEEPNSTMMIPDEPRRSNRIRLPPIRKWMNERADAYNGEIVLPREPPNKRRRIGGRPRLTVVDEKEGQFMVRSGGSHKRKFVAASKEMIRQRMHTFEYEEDDNKAAADTGHGKLSIGTVFSKDSMKAGTLVMHPESVKAQRNSGSYRQVYTVLTGCVEVELEPDSPHAEVFRTNKGGMFYIPPHNDFVLNNPSKKVLCAMSFVLVKMK
uniref:Mif2/CENP-C cupin domain-containing protein n=1 Tax=Percolomonas cosmopolitus TaxID=63605 RepID=A0A7S1KLC0_9EUKA|eukprot:CAMPEP_0117452408 /NCGR_PEP_ID=MMETSP0759-20121206/9599_1 /TAXON_ID=63605 /ORGANISM="Percolomonas cosmopolitus, Strain WS" /LENGTH=920 /DNA_ID=CAMNT_0005245221 /DNA_START=109 /DNA_END=2871 /DNA_ORIENTATION=+